MLDTHAHGETLGLEPRSGACRHLDGVEGAVSGRQHDRIAGDALHTVCVEIARQHGLDVGPARNARRLDRVDAGPEAHGAGGAPDRLPHRLDDARQAVRPDVGPPAREDLRRRTVRHQRLQNAAHRTAGCAARVELAVGVRAGAALAEAVVRLGIDGLPAVRGREGAPSRLDVAAALEHGHPEASGEAVERAEQPRGTAPDDRHVRRGRRRRREGGRCRLGPGRHRLPGAPDVDHEPPSPRARPGIERQAAQPRLGQCVGRAAERSRHRRAQRRARGRRRLGRRREQEHDLTRHGPIVSCAAARCE